MTYAFEFRDADSTINHISALKPKQKARLLAALVSPYLAAAAVFHLFCFCILVAW